MPPFHLDSPPQARPCACGVALSFPAADGQAPLGLVLTRHAALGTLAALSAQLGLDPPLADILRGPVPARTGEG